VVQNKKNEILLLACGRVDEKKISPGRSGGNIVIFFIRLIATRTLGVGNAGVRPDGIIV